MKKTRYANGGLSEIASTAEDLMANVNDMANTINYGAGNTPGQNQPLGFNSLTSMKKGGKVSSASKRADGCAIRGKTRA